MWPIVCGQSPNSRLILSPLWVLRMLSAIVGLVSIWTSLEQSCLDCEIELVTWNIRQTLHRKRKSYEVYVQQGALGAVSQSCSF